jgi:lipopolysaccharide/colanic/teichoic acid biosynthesis glycosyltransferase
MSNRLQVFRTSARAAGADDARRIFDAQAGLAGLVPHGVDPASAVGSVLGAVRGAVKRAIDIVGATALLLLVLPACALLVPLVRADGGPAFYSHPRIGRGGRAFGCLKFRTMVPDADRRLSELLETDPEARAEWETTRKLRRDPRVTRLGRFLRSSSLDELPQLLNVVRGDMSLVGPRPVTRSELANFYGPAAAALYVTVRPGITGPWQVSGRSDSSYDRRIALDVAYIRKPSLRADLLILLRTVRAVLIRDGAC